jgi:hypothetical protein
MRYAKLLAQVVATVLVALIPYLVAGGLSPVDWVNVALVGIGAAAVFTGPNVPGAPVTKTVLSVLAAVGVALNSVITGGISTAEWLAVAIAALGALGVYAVPNARRDAEVAGQRRGFDRTDTDLV